jgi:hypothetical protein
MPDIYPDLEWYAKISAQKGLPTPRCPYAAAARCPRYYQSLYLLGHAGCTQIEEADDKKLEAFWKASDLWPLTGEQATSVSGSPDRKNTFARFCPEVSFQMFGLFASDLIPYPDEQSSESAQKRLASSSGALSGKDYRWDWERAHEMHYSDCPLYSLLPYAPPDKPAPASDTELWAMKPSFAGFTLNLKVLLTRLSRWWLRRTSK